MDSPKENARKHGLIFSVDSENSFGMDNAAGKSFVTLKIRWYFNWISRNTQSANF
jgi:hypothetical protein